MRSAKRRSPANRRCRASCRPRLRRRASAQIEAPRRGRRAAARIQSASHHGAYGPARGRRAPSPARRCCWTARAATRPARRRRACTSRARRCGEGRAAVSDRDPVSIIRPYGKRNLRIGHYGYVGVKLGANDDRKRREDMPGHDVYLVGSVPMANAPQVFEAVSAALGRRSSAFRTARPASAVTGSPGSSRCSRKVRRCRSPASIFRVHATATRPRALHAQAGPHAGGRAFRQSALRRHRQSNLTRCSSGSRTPARLRRNQVSDRPRAGALGDLALSGRRAACADRPDLQRRGEARDRQDRGRAAARRDRDPVRRRVRGVRAAGAQPGEQLRRGPRTRRRRRSATS